MRWRGRDAGLRIERKGACKKPLGYLDLDQFGSNVLKRQSSSALFVKDEEGRIRTHTHTHTETRMLLELSRFALSLYVIEKLPFQPNVLICHSKYNNIFTNITTSRFFVTSPLSYPHHH